MVWDIGFDLASSSSSSSSSSVSSSSSSVSSSSFSASLCFQNIVEDVELRSSSSLSSSSSSTSTTPGTVVWGHHTAVDEDYDEDFLTNWTTTSWSISGTAGTDDEIIYSGFDAECGQESIGEDWYLGAFEAVVSVDKYQTGSGPQVLIYYKTATTGAGLVAASWVLYNGISFTSLGWIKLRIIHT